MFLLLQVVICGGSSPLLEVTEACYGLDPVSNTWVEFPSLPEPRSDAISVLTDNGWWITGGSLIRFKSLHQIILISSQASKVLVRFKYECEYTQLRDQSLKRTTIYNVP